MLCIPLWNGYFKIGGTKDDPIPYVIKLELTYIPVKHGIIDLDVNWFTVNSSALVAAYYPTCLFLMLLVPGPYQYLPMGTVSIEVSLYSILGTYVFDAFPQALNIWNYYMSYTGSSPWGGLVVTTTTGNAGALC